MAPLRPGQAYTATHQLTSAQRQGYKYKDIEKIIRQQTRPHMDIPARTKKDSIIRIWREQDRLIAERDNHEMPAEEEDEDGTEMNDADEEQADDTKPKLSLHVKAAYKRLADDGVEVPTAQGMKDDMGRWRVAYKGCRNKEELKQQWAPAWLANKDNDMVKRAIKKSVEVIQKRKRDRDDEEYDAEHEEPSKLQKTEHTKTTQKALVVKPTPSKRKCSSDDEPFSKDNSSDRAPKRIKYFTPPTTEQVVAADALVARIRSNLGIFYTQLEPRLPDVSMELLERVEATDHFVITLPEAYTKYEYEDPSDAIATEDLLMGILGEKALLKLKPNDTWHRAVRIGTGVAARRFLGMGRRGLKLRKVRKCVVKEGVVEHGNALT